MSLKRKQQGFTIVELLIVIIVIGILAALVITTFTGIQQRTRNTDRQNDIRILASQLEVYIATSSMYPTLAQLNDGTPNTGWRAVNMKGLDQDTLKDPRSTSGTLAGAPATNVYSYAVTTDDGTTACDNVTAMCTKFVLTGTLEPNGTVVKNSLN